MLACLPEPGEQPGLDRLSVLQYTLQGGINNGAVRNDADAGCDILICRQRVLLGGVVSASLLQPFAILFIEGPWMLDVPVVLEQG